MSLTKLRHALLLQNRRPVAIEKAAANVFAAVAANIAVGHPNSDTQLAAAACARGSTNLEPTAASAHKLSRPLLFPTRGGKVAVMSFRGVVSYSTEYQPYAVSTKLFAQNCRELALNDEVKNVVIIFDSPGGVVTGTALAADALFALREKKKVTAIVDLDMCSAAYWIGSQSTEIIACPDAEVGSIGVFMLHIECSKMLQGQGIKPTFIYAGEFKTEGNSLVPLATSARDHFQKECGDIYLDFLRAVARGRRVSASHVFEHYGSGRPITAKKAKKLGMIDRIEIADNALLMLGISIADSGRQANSDLGRIFQKAVERTAGGRTDLGRGKNELH